MIIEPELPNQFRHIPMLLFGVRAIPEDRERRRLRTRKPLPRMGAAPGLVQPERL